MVVLTCVEIVLVVVTTGGFVWVKASSVRTVVVFRIPRWRILSADEDSVKPPLACPSIAFAIECSLITGE
jgi:hypothetical protein